MKKSNPSKAIIAAALIAGVGGQMITAQESHAAMVIGLAQAVVLDMSMGLFGIGLGGVAGMEILSSQGTIPRLSDSSSVATIFGIFLLDEKVQKLPLLNAQDLLDNGFTAAQIERIASDSKVLDARLMAGQKMISLSSTATRAEIRNGLIAMMPEASAEFLDVTAERLHLAAQAQ